MNTQGLDKLAINFIKKIVAGSFHEKFFNCYFSKNCEMSCPNVEDSESSDKPNPFTHNFNDLHEIRLKSPMRLILAHITITL